MAHLPYGIVRDTAEFLLTIIVVPVLLDLILIFSLTSQNCRLASKSPFL